jgi:hypothetical protein
VTKFEKMYELLLSTCTTEKEEKEYMDEIINEAMTSYNGDIELAIENRFHCDMSSDDIEALKAEFK